MRRPATTCSAGGIDGAIMIGHIRFTNRGAPALALLGDDGVWQCRESGTVAAMLNRDYSPIGKPSASGNWGHWELFAAAHCLKGAASLGPPPP